MRGAVIIKCRECSGDNFINRMFCHLFDCPLWFFRLNTSPGTDTYEKSVKNQWENGETRIDEARKRGGDFSNLSQAADAVFHLKEMGFELDHFLGYKKSP